MLGLKVIKKGPLFDGRAGRVMDAYIADAEQAVAQAGVNDVRSALGSVLQNPTGYYESRIRTDLQSDDTVVTDGGVVYGPWLEGVSSRNKATRFRGYHTFRKVTQRLQSRAGAIAEEVLQRHIGRLR